MSGNLANHVEITWLGQAGFLLRFGDTAVAIDPFLSPHDLRLYPPPPDDSLGDRLDYLLATHEHGDHLDIDLLPRLIKRFPEITVVVPTPLESKVKELAPTARTKGMQPGESLIAGDINVNAVGAIHAVVMSDGYSDGRRLSGDPTPFIGYVLKFGGLSIYHAGDTLVSKELIAELTIQRVDVAILPVNGRDFFRETSGIAGNLTAREAVEVAAAIGASVLVPMHHDLVRGNTERAGACADLADDLALQLHVLNLARLKPLNLPVGVA